MSDRDDEPRFASGDQDYDSAAGWSPSVDVEKMRRDAMKRDPREWARPPRMLEIHPIADWLNYAQYYDPTTQLFGPFWRSGEVAVLFGGTGTGKSALAAQIAESLARGRALAPFDTGEAESAGPQKVLYVDFELRVFQFASRYSQTGAHDGPASAYYEFSPNLIRCELSWDGHVQDGYTGFSDMLFTALLNKIAEYEATVLIVDNITFLDRATTSNASTALYIMRMLQQLKRRSDVSVLVLAHTPKRREWMPVTEIDLQGSINLANFADSIFAVARSRVSPDLRYLKQIKVRSGRPEMTADHVPVFEFAKYDLATAFGGEGKGKDFLGFRFVEFAREADHLENEPARISDGSTRTKYDQSTIDKVKQLAAQGEKIIDIAAEVGVPRSTVHRYVRNR